MDIPFFYAPGITASDKQYTLDETAAKHAVQVLRMQAGDRLLLTDGAGKLFDAGIENAGKKHCRVVISAVKHVALPAPRRAIGISFTKNISRTEWFIEKATEIGITDIYPLQCLRTERMRYNISRMHRLLAAAMLQSRQAYLPALHDQVSLPQVTALKAYTQRYIAHCNEDDKQFLGDVLTGNDDMLVLIGPEGDFTPEETALAKAEGFKAVSLGRNRLRTETAGIVACTLMNAACGS